MSDPGASAGAKPQPKLFYSRDELDAYIYAQTEFYRELCQAIIDSGAGAPVLVAKARALLQGLKESDGG